MCAKISLVFDVVLAVNLGKQLTVDSSRSVVRNGTNLESEVRVQILDLLFLQSQHRGHFGLVAVGFHRVEGDDIPFLCTLEEFSLLLVLHIFGVEHSVFFDDAPLFLLGHQAFEHVARNIVLGLGIFAEAVSISSHLLVYHLIGNFDVVVCQFVVSVEFGIELRCNSDVESESESVLVLQVHFGGLLVVGQRVTENLQFVVLDILAQLLADHFVQHVSQHTFAIHLFH